MSGRSRSTIEDEMVKIKKLMYQEKFLGEAKQPLDSYDDIMRNIDKDEQKRKAREAAKEATAKEEERKRLLSEGSECRRRIQARYDE